MIKALIKRCQSPKCWCNDSKIYPGAQVGDIVSIIRPGTYITLIEYKNKREEIQTIHIRPIKVKLK